MPEVDMHWELRKRCMASANGDPLAAIDTLLDLMWKSYSAMEDGVPLPFNRWLIDGGPLTLADEAAELRDGYDAFGEMLERSRAEVTPLANRGASMSLHDMLTALDDRELVLWLATVTGRDFDDEGFCHVHHVYDGVMEMDHLRQDQKDAMQAIFDWHNLRTFEDASAKPWEGYYRCLAIYGAAAQHHVEGPAQVFRTEDVRRLWEAAKLTGWSDHRAPLLDALEEFPAPEEWTEDEGRAVATPLTKEQGEPS